MVLGETFGNFGFAIACRVLGLRDLGPALSPFNAFMILTGHRDAAAAHAAPLRQRARRGASTSPTTRRCPGSAIPACEGDKYHELAKRYSPKGAGAVFTFGLKGGYEAGVQARVEPQAVLAPRQYRRHALAGDPPGLDHAPPAHRRAADRRRAPARRSCACRWRCRSYPATFFIVRPPRRSTSPPASTTVRPST